MVALAARAMAMARTILRIFSHLPFVAPLLHSEMIVHSFGQYYAD